MGSVWISSERVLLKPTAVIRSWSPSAFCSNFSRFPACYNYKPSSSNRSLLFSRWVNELMEFGAGMIVKTLGNVDFLFGLCIFRDFRRQNVEIIDGRFGHCLCRVFDNSEENVRVCLLLSYPFLALLKNCFLFEWKLVIQETSHILNLKWIFLAQKLRTSKCRSLKDIKFLQNNEDCTILEKSTSLATRRRKKTSFLDFQDSIMPVQNQLKFMILCGLFTLQGTPQALAGSDIVHQLQSIVSLGDLDDISTGFASVRIISL